MNKLICLLLCSFLWNTSNVPRLKIIFPLLATMTVKQLYKNKLGSHYKKSRSFPDLRVVIETRGLKIFCEFKG